MTPTSKKKLARLKRRLKKVEEVKVNNRQKGIICQPSEDVCFFTEIKGRDLYTGSVSSISEAVKLNIARVPFDAELSAKAEKHSPKMFIVYVSDLEILIAGRFADLFRQEYTVKKVAWNSRMYRYLTLERCKVARLQ